MARKRLLRGFPIIAAAALILGGLATARSQSTPQATPGMFSAIPTQAPPTWRQHDWDALRAQCLRLGAEFDARQHLTAAQMNTTRPFTFDEIEQLKYCASLGPRPAAPLPPNAPPAGNVAATPLSTPSTTDPSSGTLRPLSHTALPNRPPPAASVGPGPTETLSASANLSLASGCTSSDTILGPFQTCPGASQSACISQPPDVAGEVSPT
jgi:hypothetical protein